MPMLTCRKSTFGFIPSGQRDPLGLIIDLFWPVTLNGLVVSQYESSDVIQWQMHHVFTNGSVMLLFSDLLSLAARFRRVASTSPLLS